MVFKQAFSPSYLDVLLGCPVTHSFHIVIFNLIAVMHHWCKYLCSLHSRFNRYACLYLAAVPTSISLYSFILSVRPNSRAYCAAALQSLTEYNVRRPAHLHTRLRREVSSHGCETVHCFHWKKKTRLSCFVCVWLIRGIRVDSETINWIWKLLLYVIISV